MDLAIYAIIIGVINYLLYIGTTATLITILVQLIHTNDSANTNGTQIAITSIAVVFSLVMVLICGLLVMGARMRRPSLIAPWLFLTIVGISSSIVALIIQGHKLPFRDILLRVIYIVLASLICYPIYRLWRELQFGEYTPLLDYPGQPSPSPLLQQQQQPPSPNNVSDTGSDSDDYQKDHFGWPKVHSRTSVLILEDD